MAGKRNPTTNAATETHGILSGTMGAILTTRAAETTGTRTAGTRIKANATAEETSATVNAVDSLETQPLNKRALTYGPR